jgi:hypothetical protein
MMRCWLSVAGAKWPGKRFRSAVRTARQHRQRSKQVGLLTTSALLIREARLPKWKAGRKAQGYVGRGGVERFENEVLMPMMLRHESNLRADQVQIDDAVEHILHGVPDPVERSLYNSGIYGLKRK